MEIEGVRTDRLGLLLDQFDKAREMAGVRLAGLGDEEYRWEPVIDRWRADVGALTEDQLDTVGRSQYPYGSVQVPTDPFGRIIGASPAPPGATHDLTALNNWRLLRKSGAAFTAGSSSQARKALSYQGK